jgi:hypothetical protein
MNWDALGAIGEAVGAIAVFVSLVYVAIQIRQSTKQLARGLEASQLAAFEQNVESGNRIRELLIVHPDLAQLLLSGFKDYKGLKGPERLRFDMLLRNIFAGIQAGYIRQLSLKHDPMEFEGTARMLDDILVHRGAREWLAENEPDWRPAFRELLDKRLVVISRRKADRSREAEPRI